MDRRYFLALLLIVAGITSVACSSSGNAGSVKITDRTNTAAAHPSIPVTVTATCNQGESIVSGGFAITTQAYRVPNDATPSDQYWVFASYPPNSSSWTASFLNNTSGDNQGDALAVVHAECASGLSGPVSIVSSPGSEGTNQSAVCPQGNLTGGGFNVTNVSAFTHFITILFSRPTGVQTSPTTWTVASNLSNSNTDPQRLVAYAVCTQALKTSFGASLQLSAPPGPLPPPNTQNPMASATQAQGSYGCAQLFGQSLVGSGFSKDGPIPAGLPISSFYPSFPNWFMILNSVPVPSIEGQFFNAGGQASIFPVCSS